MSKIIDTLNQQSEPYQKHASKAEYINASEYRHAWKKALEQALLSAHDYERQELTYRDNQLVESKDAIPADSDTHDILIAHLEMGFARAENIIQRQSIDNSSIKDLATTSVPQFKQSPVNHGGRPIVSVSTTDKVRPATIESRPGLKAMNFLYEQNSADVSMKILDDFSGLHLIVRDRSLVATGIGKFLARLEKMFIRYPIAKVTINGSIVFEKLQKDRDYNSDLRSHIVNKIY